MADATTDMSSSPATPAAARPAIANPSGGAQIKSPGKDPAMGAHAAAAATFDALLASEARANMKRSRIPVRDDLVKYKQRVPVPPAKIIIRPVRTQAWMTPFISLAVVVGISTCVSAGAIAYLFLRPLADATSSDAEMRSMRESLTQLRRNVAELSANVTTNRNALDAAAKAGTDRGGRPAQSPDRMERTASIPALATNRPTTETAQVMRSPTVEVPADVTGSVQQPQGPSGTSREIIAGWHIRRAYDGTAVLEGKPGVIEVTLGQEVPGLGRVQEIKSENGRWQVVTSKGVVLSTR